jgi:hypothetical protein
MFMPYSRRVCVVFVVDLQQIWFELIPNEAVTFVDDPILPT